MTHATEARDKLLARTAQVYRLVHAAATGAGRAYTDLPQGDVEETMEGVINIILALADLETAASEAVKTLRDALAQAFDETGAPKVYTDHHMAYMSNKAEFLSIENEAAVPDNYWVKRIDRDAIKADLKAGIVVASCAMVRPNTQVLNIRKRNND